MSEGDKKLGALPFVIAGLSYIPLIGVLFGVVAFVWGVVTRRSGGKKLALIGAGGILFTISLYGSLFYFGFVRRKGVFADLRLKLAQIQLNQLVPQIELYKIQYGHYPASLEELRKALPKDSMVFVFDSACAAFDHNPRLFFYEKVGDDHYRLLSVGPDCKAHTADDIQPQIDSNSAGKVGFLLEGSAERSAGADHK